MSRGGWIRWIAFGLIASVIVAAFVVSIFIFDHYYQTQYKVVSDQAARSQNYQKLIICPDIKPEGSVDQNCVNKLEYDSFILQQNSTEFTYWASVVGIYTSIISIFGLIGLFVSLYQTRASLADNRQFGVMQTRAYLAVKSVTLTREDGNRIVTVTIENVGNTPAYSIMAGLNVVASRPEDLNVHAVQLRRVPDIAPTHSPSAKTFINTEEWAVISDACGLDEVNCYAHGIIKYVDAFGFARWTSFRRHIPKTEANQLREMDGMVISAEGNESDVKQ